MNLFHEFLDAVEPSFVPQLPVEENLESLPVEILLEAVDEHLDLVELLIEVAAIVGRIIGPHESRSSPDIDQARISTSVNMNVGEIDTVRWSSGVEQVEIRSWKADLASTAVSLNHGAVERHGASQEAAGCVELPFEYGIANFGRRNRCVVDQERCHLANFDAVGKGVSQHRRIALRVLSEGRVETHQQITSSETGADNVSHEFLRRHFGHGLVEAKNNGDIEPGPLEKNQAMVERSEHDWRATTENRQRMTLERNDDRFTGSLAVTQFSRPRAQAAEALGLETASGRYGGNQGKFSRTIPAVGFLDDATSGDFKKTVKVLPGANNPAAFALLEALERLTED